MLSILSTLSALCTLIALCAPCEARLSTLVTKILKRHLVNKQVTEHLAFTHGANNHTDLAPHCEMVKYSPPATVAAFDNLTYDFRDAYPGCTLPIVDQGLCSGSWAIAISSLLSLKVCASSTNQDQKESLVSYSSQYLLSCLTATGCFGVDARVGFEHVHQTGLPTEECIPFSIQTQDYGAPPDCPNACTDGTVPTFTKIAGAHAYGGNATHIAKLLMENGPLYAEMLVYKDFLTYHTGIYNRTSTDYIGTQAVVLVGFGVDPGRNVSYWIAQNSWGSSWGEDGMFRILKGVNECGIENRVVYIDY